MVIDIEDDKDDEFIKEELKQRHSANNYTSMSHFWISLDATWEDQLVLVGHISLR